MSEFDQGDQTQFWFKVASAIGGLLCVAFVAWAGVVYEGVQMLTDRISDQIRTTAVLEVTVRTFAKRMEMHEEIPWHAAAGEAHVRTQERLDNQAERLNNIERHMNQRRE